MSDNGNENAGASVAFTEREMQMLAWAMQSLKSGPPEIDYEKLAGFAGMGNPRSASNAWAKIRNKLNASTGGGDALATPKKGGAKKKAAAKDDDEADETPKKTPRKRAAKKQEVDGEASPKKKAAASKAKKEKVESDEEPADVKAEDKDTKMEGTDSQDLQPEGDVKADDEAAVGEDEI